MNGLQALYRPSLALLTDLYQLTMAYAAWKGGVEGREAVFHLHFRKHPFRGGFTVAAGLEQALDLLESFHFDEGDLAFLATLKGADGAPLFEPGFLRYLGALRLTLDVDAVPEGTVVFPQEPLVRVVGPVIPCMLLETPLLTLLNFQTLVATKAARVCLAAGGQEVLEFGLRRAQGVDGGLSASRAAYIGGCTSTSNTLAGRLYGIPVRGTHAHSWVMLFGDELEAFRAYAHALPNNCIFLVDTYDTLEGVRHAIQVGRELRERGHRLLGIRLDSGDLAWLSQQARALLDEAGFADARILASNELDEHVIESLALQGAPITVWGVGTRLVTAFDEPALGGVYKLSAVREQGGPWQHRVKLSEQRIKVTTPGLLQVRRFHEGGHLVADMIFDESQGAPSRTLVDPLDPTRRRTLPADMPHEDVLVPVFRGGRRVHSPEPIDALRARTLQQLSRLHPSIKRSMNPHEYPVGLESGLDALKTRLILEARGLTP